MERVRSTKQKLTMWRICEEKKMGMSKRRGSEDEMTDGGGRCLNLFCLVKRVRVCEVEQLQGGVNTVGVVQLQGRDDAVQTKVPPYNIE